MQKWAQVVATAIGALFQAIENALEREKDHLPLWIPVGIGIGIALWQQFGDGAAVPVTLTCAAVILFGFGIGNDRRISALMKAAGAAILLGFGVIAFKSASVASPVLPKVWVGKFFGRITKVETLSARDVIRLQLETDGHQALPQ